MKMNRAMTLAAIVGYSVKWGPLLRMREVWGRNFNYQVELTRLLSLNHHSILGPYMGIEVSKECEFFLNK